MAYTEKDFENLTFNPLCVGLLLKTYPKLNEIVQDADGDSDRLLRYVILTCDPKSVLFIEEKDLNHRKVIAADLVQLDSDDEFREAVFSYKHPTVLQLTVNYLKHFAKSKQYAAIVALEYTYWESIRLLLKPIDDTLTGAKDRDVLDAVQKKGAIKNEIDADLKRLDTYYSQFFGEDKELELKAKETIRPENVRSRYTKKGMNV